MSRLRTSEGEVGRLEPGSDKRDVAYRVGRPDLDPWPIFGTLTLVLFVFAFGFILWQARHALLATSNNTPMDRIVLIASPQPTRVSTPGPDPTPSPTGQLVDTGSTNAPAEPAATAPAPTPITPAPKPTPTHKAPTAIINVTPKAGLSALHVTADASFSWDATGIVSYQFNWGDGLVDPPQTSPVATHVYAVIGQWWITVTVVNRVGLSASAKTDIRVN